MDDVFVERLVARKMGPKEMGIKALIALAAVVLIFVSGTLGAILMPLVAAVALVGGWYLWVLTNVEYEYSLSNGDLTVDAIYGQRRRKNRLEVNLRERLELMAPLSPRYQSELSRACVRVLDVASAPNADNRWFLLLRGENGLTRVIFEPDQRMVDAIRRCAPSKVQTEW